MKKTDENGHPQVPRWRQEARIMKLYLILTFVGILQLSAKTYSQETKLDISLNNATLENVMNTIREQSEYSFFFDDAAVKKISNISLDMKEASVEEVLAHCLEGTGFSFRIIDKTIILFRQQQQKERKVYTIKGQVVDEKNMPMAGVTVILDSTQIGVSTNAEGRFAFASPREKGKLVFSFIGFKTQKVAFTAGKELLVKMVLDVSNLDEVQVVAYGSQKKRTLVSAISSVKGEDLQELPTHSLENLLQGHMAGVEVNNISGSPGGGGTVVAIRGYNSLFVEGESDERNYGAPLYVVDGVPMQAFTSPITGANTLSDLDPSMIESVEVLKDAASAAIYGSRAGNGVILITTKRGKAGKAQFSANASYSASWLPKSPEQIGGRMERMYHLNALRNSVLPYQDEDGNWKMPTSYKEVYDNREKYGPMYNWFFGQDEGPQNAYALQDSLNPYYNNSTDWWRQNYQVGKVLNANLQASGGSETMRYMVGAAYYDEEGIMRNTGFKRFTFTSNLTANPTKKLRMDTQLGLTYSDRSRGTNAGSNATKIESITSDPTATSTLLPGDGYVGEQMMKVLNLVTEKNQSYSARLNMMLDYEIIRNLHLKVSGGFNFNQQNQNVFQPSALDAYTHFSKSTGSIGRELSILNENLLTYDFSIRNQHNFSILLGLSFQKDQSFKNSGSGTNGPNDKIQYVDASWGGASGLNNVGGSLKSAFSYASSFTEERMNSYFGRLSYNFREKYMLEATLRRDGSSVFGADVRWATFPSVAVGWAFSEEPFMKNLYWLSFAKIRLSWGVSGQKFTQRYLAQGLITSTGGSFLGNTGMQPSTEGGVINKKLTWEETDQFDLGLDLNFLDYRLKLQLDYYYRYTSEQLNQIDLPGNIYFHTFQWQNAMAVSNQGLELELEADIFRETAVKWRMKFNASRNWNRFEKSSDGYDFSNHIIGKSLNQLSAYKTDGFYTSLEEVPMYYTANKEKQPLHGSNSLNSVYSPGSRKLVDLDGDGVISESDMYLAASPLPIAHGGFINEIRWKNFDLNIFFNYSIGRHAVKIYDDFSIQPKKDGGPLFVEDIDYWTPGATSATYPNPQQYNVEDQYAGYYDCDIENVHFLRLKQLTLGYNLGSKALNKLNLRGARLFATFENLFLLTNYSGLDPELIDITNGSDNLRSYPLPRKFTIGLSVNF